MIGHKTVTAFGRRGVICIHQYLKYANTHTYPRADKWSGGICGGGLVAQSCPTLATPWTVAHQAPPSMGFLRQEYWSELPFPSLGDFLAQGSNPGLLHCRQILYCLSHQPTCFASWYCQCFPWCSPNCPSISPTLTLLVLVKTNGLKKVITIPIKYTTKINRNYFASFRHH